MKNKYGLFVLNRAINLLKENQIKDYIELLTKKMNKNDLTTKEIDRYSSIIEMLKCKL